MRDLAILNRCKEETYLAHSTSLYELNTHHISQGPVANVMQIIQERIQSKRAFFSVEFIPGSTKDLQDLLNESLQALVKWPPLFASVTWQPSALQIIRDKSSGKIIEVNHPALVLCTTLQSKYNIPALLHLSAGLHSAAEIKAILNKAQAVGIRNVLALRGDLDNSDPTSIDFHHAFDLVSFIRREYGALFTVGVAGYPAGHPEAPSYGADLQHLKEKVDAGADFILTQMAFTAKTFQIFLKDCQDCGITKPIIPGLLPIQSYKSLQKVATICKVNVPKKLSIELGQLCGHGKSEKELCIKQIENLIEEMLFEGCWPGFHFFTLNRAILTLDVCQRLGLEGCGPKE